MRERLSVGVAVGILALCAAGLVRAKEGTTMKRDVVRPAGTVQWKDGPAAGTHTAPLWGDMDKGGPYGVMIKFDAGLRHPPHRHSKDMKIVVVSGTFIHQPEGGTETRLGPGSYLLQAGNAVHSSGCSQESDCEFFMESSDKFDMTMVGGGKE
jgi:hypothetical protein